MGDLFIYILKSSACLVIFYLFYRLLMRKETFHRFNRIALLSILLLSSLIPFIHVSVDNPTEVHRMVTSYVEITGQTVTIDEQSTAIGWAQIVLIIYLTGIVFFMACHLYSLMRMLLLLRSSKKERLANGVILVVHHRDISPFSWMKYIVVSQKDLEEDGREILIHEQAHISHRHSVDMLLADVCIILQWFNPAAWLMKQELQNIHEYEADEAVINEGVNAKEYQLLLIKKAVGTRLYSMANSFNHSKLKKRITMMSKRKSNPWARLKCLYVLPVAVVSIAAFARPEIASQLGEISRVKVNDLTEIVKTNAVDNTAASHANSSLNVASVSKKIEGIIKDKSGKPVQGVLVSIKGSTNAVISDADGKFTIDRPANSVLQFAYKNAVMDIGNADMGSKMDIIVDYNPETGTVNMLFEGGNKTDKKGKYTSPDGHVYTSLTQNSAPTDSLKRLKLRPPYQLTLNTIKLSDDKTMALLKGLVVDAKNKPMTGKKITFKNSKLNTQTDSEGKFSLEVPSDLKDVIYCDEKEVGRIDISNMTLLNAASQTVTEKK